MEKKRKKVGLIIMGSIIVISLIGLYLVIFGGPPIKTIDVNNYGDFDDFKGYSNLYIFPTQIPNSKQIDSYYYYQRDTLFDPTCQIFLEYSLSNTEFRSEVARLSKISERYEHEAYKNIVNSIVYDTEHFRYPAYVAIFNNDQCYEYALINEQESKIIYVFVQFIKPNKIVFDKEYLPINYGKHDSGEGFNIYYSEKRMGYFERHKR